jgi:transposase
MNKLVLTTKKDPIESSTIIQSEESLTIDLPSSVTYSNNNDDEFGFELDDGIERLTHSTSSFQSIDSSKLNFKRMNLEGNSDENFEDEEEDRKNKRIDSYKNFKDLILDDNNQNFFRSGDSFKIKEIPSSMTLEVIKLKIVFAAFIFLYFHF